MRPHIFARFAIALSLATSAAAGTRGLAPGEEAAYREARSIYDRLPPGEARRDASVYLAMRLLGRGECEEALPILNRDMIGMEEVKPLALMALLSAVSRDPRCTAWSAARLKAASEAGRMNAVELAMIRFHTATLFNLTGQYDRTAQLGPIATEPLEFVPKELQSTTLAVGGLNIDIVFANPPKAHQLLLIERLSLYRGTALHERLARALAARAKREPAFLTDTGWVEVALALLEHGDADGARQLLADGQVGLLSFEGLEAEAAIRRKDYAAAARKLVATNWLTRDKTVDTMVQLAPETLLPTLDDDSLWGERGDWLRVAMLVESLDRHGDPAGAERAARATLRRFDADIPALNREAQMHARLGEMDKARAMLAEAERNRAVSPMLVRMAIATGAALHGDSDGALGMVRGIDPAKRASALVALLTTAASAPPEVRGRIEHELETLLDGPRPIDIPREDILALAKEGASARLLSRLSGLPAAPEERARLAISVAWFAAHGADGNLARALADRALAGLPEGPDSDRHLVALARVYAKLGDIAASTAIARRVEKPAARVDALTASIENVDLNLVPKLSFETF
ncbi:MAG TPA: hypothetical protein VK472_04915 [Allosphingosinicella sp.]|nr:hypothetical protein [Allosphingosinicella sp.]